jgi:hypothetical protein
VLWLVVGFIFCKSVHQIDGLSTAQGGVQKTAIIGARSTADKRRRLTALGGRKDGNRIIFGCEAADTPKSNQTSKGGEEASIQVVDREGLEASASTHPSPFSDRTSLP